MKSKRGFVYFVEITLAVIFLAIVLSGFIESDQRVFEYKQQQDLRLIGWQTLSNLDELGVFTDPLNFSKIDLHVQESLPLTVGYDLEYYNDTCYPVNSGSLGSGATHCPSISASTDQDIISIYYTLADGETDSIKLYLWRLF